MNRSESVRSARNSSRESFKFHKKECLVTEMKQALILAGGKAERLKPHTFEPKPFLTLNGETILEWQLKSLEKHGFEHIIVTINAFDVDECLHLLGDYVERFPVKLAIEETQLGTGGAIRNALDFIQADSVYIMNVDYLVDANSESLYFVSDAGASILLARPSPFGPVEESNPFVADFVQKPILDHWVNAGHYVFKKSIIAEYFPQVSDLEVLVLPKLAKERKLRCVKRTGNRVTINTYKDLLEARLKFAAYRPKASVY